LGGRSEEERLVRDAVRFSRGIFLSVSVSAFYYFYYRCTGIVWLLTAQ
jgi:hypothetical protein